MSNLTPSAFASTDSGLLLPKNVFNINKSDYIGTSDRSLFLGEEPGLFDTVNRQHPKFWEL